MSKLEDCQRWSADGQGLGPNLSREVVPSGKYLGSVVGLGLVVVHLLSCEPNLVIATWSCPKKGESSLLGTAGAAGAAVLSGTAGAAGSGGATKSAWGPIEVPWSNGFESGFCEYSGDDGFCLERPDQMAIVAEPVHSGSYAAAYTTSTSTNTQSRCVRKGSFPPEPYYGAWYFIAYVPKNVWLWNLFHFQGGNTPGETFHDLWDVSLVKKDNGSYRLELYNFPDGWEPIAAVVPNQSNAPSVPIGKWFHIELYVKRAADSTGEFRLYQDGALILQATGLPTDDAKYGQWFVGNIAEPSKGSQARVDSTVYVDDVSVATTLSSQDL